MFSSGFKERHPTLFSLLAGFAIAFFALWLYLWGIAWFMRSALKLREAYYHRGRHYIILFFPNEEKKPKPRIRP